MKEQNEVIEKLNEEVMNEVGTELSTSNGNVLVKVLVGAVAVAAGVGAFIFLKKKRDSKKCVITELTVEDETVEENDVEKYL